MIYLGELAALFAAFLWAASSVAFRYIGRSVSPLHLNFTKGAVAIALIGLTLTLQQDWTPGGNWRAIALLLASGALGIGIGDTFFLSAINTIGPRRTLILEALSPPPSCNPRLRIFARTTRLGEPFRYFPHRCGCDLGS
ncbi:MAG: EamA family transporter [Desertifilum sp.]|nr:EamA family transporter [Desertifilum sp.]